MRGGRSARFGGEEDRGAPIYDARLMRRFYRYVGPYRPFVLASLALLLAGSAAQLVQPYLLKIAIDDFVLAGRREGLARIAALFLAAFATEIVLRFAQIWTMERAGQGLIADLRAELFGHLQRLPAGFFDRNPVGRLMSRVTTDAEALSELFSSGVVSVLGDLLRLGAIVALLLWMDRRLALVTFLVVPALVAMSLFFRQRLRRTYRLVRRRIAAVNGYLQENLTGIRIVQLFRREERNRGEFRRVNREHCDAELDTVLYDSIFSAAVEWIGSVSLALLVWYGGGEVVRGAVTFGTLVAFMEYTQKFFVPIRDLSSQFVVLQSGMAALERVFGLLDTPVPPASGPLRPLPARLRGAVEFRDVEFAYDGGPPVLRGVGLRLEPGERVALIGPTGAGKTSLVKLLIRLYEPTAGRITVDGVDLREVDPGELRRRIGVVLQDGYLFAGSIASNIAFGRADLPEERIREAARLAEAEPFILGLERGYGEEVRERGGNLSSGQKQLLALARVIAVDPEILVLDEATASIDPVTEERIRSGIRRALAGRTALVIAHRLSTLAAVDRILVLDHGRVVEAGTHAELLRRGGLYRRYFELQRAG
ncbi:MAG: ABC transporter ATP-binding protein [Acidobacteria bacterium]|nr:ABC transporter ATP-binding protein [Acidobacteriota bacterium]